LILVIINIIKYIIFKIKRLWSRNITILEEKYIKISYKNNKNILERKYIKYLNIYKNNNIINKEKENKIKII
jgi:hypothetical protein